MEYFLDLTYDPVIFSFYVSLVLAIGLAYIWNRLYFRPYSYVTARPTVKTINCDISQTTNVNKMQHPIILWIMKFVRRKESRNEDPDHHLFSHKHNPFTYNH